MNVHVITALDDADALIAGLYEGAELTPAVETLDAALGGLIREISTSGDLNGKVGATIVLYPRGALPAKRLILVNLGKRDALTPDSVRRAAALSAQKARDLKAAQVTISLLGGETLDPEKAAEAVVEGALLGLYSYHGQKSSPAPTSLPKTFALLASPELESPAKTGAEAGRIIAEAAALARTLTNLPPNICTPDHMGEVAHRAAEAAKLRVEVLHQTQIEALKMGALLSVAKGSDTPPRFIILEHNAGRANELPTVVLVGKGVTFDTGGYSIKTAEGMVGMKGDMAGGAAVIGALQAAGQLRLPLHVVGLVPAADNRINGSAYTPQEVVTASNGMTIEIISTDAEGRMLLADALVFAARYKPAAVIDIATLTGSKSIALGSVAAALYSTDDTLRDRLMTAGQAVNERLWPMPMLPEYDKLIESKTADMKNTGGRYGGANIAAMFLKRFTAYPAWAHIDMAGQDTLDSSDTPYVPVGATGFGVRLFVDLLRRWSASA